MLSLHFLNHQYLLLIKLEFVENKCDIYKSVCFGFALWSHKAHYELGDSVKIQLALIWDSGQSQPVNIC